MARRSCDRRWLRLVEGAVAEHGEWVPERDVCLRPLAHRSLQLGLTGEAAHRYADEWTVSVTGTTDLAREIHGQARDGDLEAARRLLPRELPCPVPEGLLDHLRP
ncbi:DUF4291 family protein [Streptomyces sp. NPDC001812]|uniref:DUF4291 family protein n=1 Tax=Streptomyces TaxID=1883 RepID=UPI00365FB6DA